MADHGESPTSAPRAYEELTAESITTAKLIRQVGSVLQDPARSGSALGYIQFELLQNLMGELRKEIFVKAIDEKILAPLEQRLTRYSALHRALYELYSEVVSSIVRLSLGRKPMPLVNELSLYGSLMLAQLEHDLSASPGALLKAVDYFEPLMESYLTLIAKEPTLSHSCEHMRNRFTALALSIYYAPEQ